MATSFFSKHGIPYYEMKLRQSWILAYINWPASRNARIFIWVDLRHLLVSKSSVEKSDYSALKVTSPEAPVYLQRELRIAEICLKKMVL
jgi:hypothetical protein